MWALHVTSGLSPDLTDQLLGDASPYVRGWTIQLLTEGADRFSGDQVAKLGRIARDDNSQVVRLYLASALQQMPLDQRWWILGNLASHAEDASDHNLPLMYLVCRRTARGFGSATCFGFWTVGWRVHSAAA